MKKLILTASIAGSVLLLGACGSNEEVVKIGSDKITKEEFYQEMKATQGQQVLQRLIENRVLAANFTVSDVELKKEIETLKSSFTSEEEYVSALAQYGYSTDESIEEYVKTTLLKFKAISNGIKVTDEQLEKFYTENKDNYLTLDASHILVDSEEKATELLNKIKDGGDFATIAKENSADGSASNGGSLGEFGKGQMIPEFETAAFALKAGEISNVVKTEYGYHIIKVNKVNERTIANSKEDIMRDYIIENGKEIEEVMVDLLKKEKIEMKDTDYKDLVTDMISSYQLSLDSKKQTEQTEASATEAETKEATKTEE